MSFDEPDEPEVKPVTPGEMAKKPRKIPGPVIQVFNELIERNWDGRKATVMLDDAAALGASRMEIPESEVYSRRYLDVEPVFRAAGWNVEHDKPGYNESYEAYFVFRK